MNFSIDATAFAAASATLAPLPSPDLGRICFEYEGGGQAEMLASSTMELAAEQADAAPLMSLLFLGVFGSLFVAGLACRYVLA